MHQNEYVFLIESFFLYIVCTFLTIFKKIMHYVFPIQPILLFNLFIINTYVQKYNIFEIGGN